MITRPSRALSIASATAGTAGYGHLLENATEYDMDNLLVMVASLDDLIRMKRAAGRPKDRVEIEILSALKEERQKLTPSS
jgi:hypothetical protein